jgi:hypothetical protein
MKQMMAGQAQVCRLRVGRWSVSTFVAVADFSKSYCPW